MSPFLCSFDWCFSNASSPWNVWIQIAQCLGASIMGSLSMVDLDIWKKGKFFLHLPNAILVSHQWCAVRPMSSLSLSLLKSTSFNEIHALSRGPLPLPMRLLSNPYQHPRPLYPDQIICNAMHAQCHATGVRPMPRMPDTTGDLIATLVIEMHWMKIKLKCNKRFTRIS